MEYIDNVYVINLDRSKDRFQSIKSILGRENIQFTKISAIDGVMLSDDDVSKHCTKFAETFCPKTIIGCAMSHKKTWRKIVENNDKYAIVFEDDVFIDKNFKSELKKCLDELFTFDQKFDFLYLGYFGPAKITDNSFINHLQNIILYKLSNKKCDLENVFIPVSPVGFHCYIISKECAKKLLKSMNKINYHIDVEFLKYANTLNLRVYACKNRIGYQFSTVENSFLNDCKFPKLLNILCDNIKDKDHISYSYWLNTPILKIKNFHFNLYSFLFLSIIIVLNKKINILFLIYLYLESSLDININNISIILLYMIIIIFKIFTF